MAPVGVMGPLRSAMAGYSTKRSLLAAQSARDPSGNRNVLASYVVHDFATEGRGLKAKKYV